MPSTLTPNMGLILPTIGQEPGPDYGTDQNNSFSIVDSHDHTPGKGVQITPSAISINTDLTFLSNNATNLRSIRFAPQSGPLSGGTDLGCLYENGVDLYYNDGNGNQIRLTQSGSIAGTSGSISGLVSPASATYSAISETFIWQSDTSTPANLDAGSVIIRQVLANAKGITLASPSSLANNYTITLPGATPANTSIMQMDSSGNVSAVLRVDGTTIANSGTVLSIVNGGVDTTQLANNSVTPAKLSTVNFATATTGSGSTSSTSFVNLCFGTITASGVRPIRITLGPQPGAGLAFFSTGNGSTTDGVFYLSITRDDGTTWEAQLGFTNGSGAIWYTPVSCIEVFDPSPNAGSRTYSLNARVVGICNLDYAAIQMNIVEE